MTDTVRQTTKPRHRRVGLWISLVVVFGLLTGAIFLYRWHKMRSVESAILETASWSDRAVIVPNHLKVTDLAGGGPNWLGLGRFTFVLETMTPSGSSVTFFFDIDSSITRVKVVEVLMAIRASDLDLRAYSPKEVARILKTPSSDPIQLAEAEHLTNEEWGTLATSDPVGIVRVLIPPERLQSKAPFLLCDAIPSVFKGTGRNASTSSTRQAPGQTLERP